MAWERKVSRTLRVRNEHKLGVLANLVTTIAEMGGSVGDIQLLNETSRSIVRDIVVYGDDA
ncbi:MAG TPA: hypothetical protein VMJ64_11530, partial [Anaerolineales bacterium]|nr:hypothetical protein [Anaerolineales bacterium]